MQLNPWQFIDYERTVPLSYHRQRMKGAVRTTRIYCRPVCPVKHPLTRNVTYYPTAAAAEAAGYRPCLRCRPETAPFCPAWNGTRSTVARALKLIDGGALERGSVDALAEKLGITSRHLARLFERHVGASPQQVATTRRVLQSLRPLDHRVCVRPRAGGGHEGGQRTATIRSVRSPHERSDRRGCRRVRLAPAPDIAPLIRATGARH